MNKRISRFMSMFFCCILFLTVACSVGSLRAEAAVSCVWCHGRGEVVCTNCYGGMGYRCYRCHGSGYITCKYCYGRGYLGSSSSSGSSSGSSSASSSAKITLSSKKLTLVAGRTAKLKVSGTKKKVTWSSSKKSVATVSRTGKVKAKKAGKATITARVGTKKLKCKVTVKKKVYAKNVKFSQTSKSMLVGETAAITPTVTPSGVTEKYKLTWSSSNSSVAAVDQSGNITARGAGTAVITAKLKKKKASCTITVTTGAQRLKSHITSKGTAGAGGTFSVSGSGITLSYNSSTRMYTLQYRDGTARLTLTCKETFTGNASVYYYWHGSFTDSEVEGTTSLNIPTYTESTRLSISYTPGKSSNRALVKTSLRVALLSFQSYLKNSVGINLNQLGFYAYK